eukprot:1649644-Alexandrium_andersonii.AAC.1
MPLLSGPASIRALAVAFQAALRVATKAAMAVPAFYLAAPCAPPFEVDGAPPHGPGVHHVQRAGGVPPPGRAPRDAASLGAGGHSGAGGGDPGGDAGNGPGPGEAVVAFHPDGVLARRPRSALEEEAEG